MARVKTKEPRVGRGLFLKVRLAYIQELVSEGEGQPHRIMDACNIHDPGQANLLAATSPGFDDGSCTSELLALLRALRPETIAELFRGLPHETRKLASAVLLQTYLDEVPAPRKRGRR